jgi:hypothetical protein
VLRDLDVNSLAVPRKAKEAIGGIAKLTHLNGQYHFYLALLRPVHTI